MTTATSRCGRKRLREKKLPAHDEVTTSSTTATTMFIPRDIIVEIFSWLPLKSHLRFRRGCKYLSDIISHPDSLKLHFQRYCSTSRRIIQLQRPSLLIHRSKGLGRKLSQCYLKSYNGRSSCSLSSQVRISHPLESVAAGFVSLGSCNGLLLYTSDDHKKLCIWNPFTQEYKMLPDPVSVVETDYPIYGFGYDHTIDDYKVIRSVFTTSDVEVYTLRTNSWRSIERNPCLLQHRFYIKKYSSGKFVNGFLYWMDSSGRKIISFDIAKEKFQEVTTSQLPECFLGKMYTMDLHVFEGSLCLVQNINEHDNHYHLQMWVTKDNGVNEYNSNSWTPLFAKPIGMYVGNGYDKRIKPLVRFSENGNILLLKHGIDLVLFDPKSNSIRYVVTNRICRDGEVTEVYTKSLVSLNSGTYVQGYKAYKKIIQCNMKCKQDR